MAANRTIHYSQLPPAQPGSLLSQEWETYRREAGRLLAEGNEGRWVLIKGERIVGVYETLDEARAAGYGTFRGGCSSSSRSASTNPCTRSGCRNDATRERPARA